MLVFGLVMVPMVCAGVIAVLYGMAFPSIEIVRNNVMARALASCRFAIISHGTKNDTEGLMLRRAPNHAEIAGDKFHFTWHDIPPDGDGDIAPAKTQPTTCLGTLDIGTITNLQINGEKVKY